MSDKGALDGLRILDFTFAWAGPYATELLAFMGAEVIKVESKKRLDHSRTISLTTTQVFTGTEQSPVYNDLNLNKLCVRLNLKEPKAIKIAMEIAKGCDVVIQNMRPGVMDRLGLGYEAIRDVRPDVIYVSSSARGAIGPEKNYIGYAPSFGALSGLSHITGYPDTAPAMLMGEIDLISATTSAFTILSALHHRQKTGEGQHIDLSSSESISVLMGEVFMDYAMNDRIQNRNGNRDEIMAPHNSYRCKEDGWVTIAVGSEDEWKALCNAIGKSELIEDAKFSDAYNRWNNQEELDLIINEWTFKYSHKEAMEILQNVGVAAVPYFNSKDLFTDPHLKEREFSCEVEHPVIGKRIVVNPPWKFSDTPAKIHRHGPLLGEHNEHVFCELLGMSKEEIKKLEEDEVIY